MAFTSTSFAALHHAAPLEKGGVGSRGGRVIGYTRSSKAIYSGHAAGHEHYADFSAKDHGDASYAHSEKADHHEKRAQEGHAAARLDQKRGNDKAAEAAHSGAQRDHKLAQAHQRLSRQHGEKA